MLFRDSAVPHTHYMSGQKGIQMFKANCSLKQFSSNVLTLLPHRWINARTAGGSGLELYLVKLLYERLGLKVGAELNDDVFSIAILI